MNVEGEGVFVVRRVERVIARGRSVGSFIF